MLACLNKLLWGILTIFLIYMGVKYTFKFKFIQFKFKKIVKSLINDKSTFKTLCLSLAGKIGVGSVAGVALAIYIGGPGTIFWIWISTFIVAPFSFLESYLALKYKIRKKDEFIGGPSLYIDKGLNKKKLSIIYALLIIFVYIGGFLTIQSNSISKLLSSLMNINPFIVGVLLAISTFIIIIKGIKEISLITLFLTPLMTISYILLGLIVIFNNYEMIPKIIMHIIAEGLNFNSFFSSFIPVVIIGIERGIFSSEAGIGAAAIAVGSSDSNDLHKQGYSQVFGTYFISLLICTITAIIILTTNYQILTIKNVNGIEIAQYAFNYHFGKFGEHLLFLITFSFCFSTIIAGYYFGESSLKYIYKNLSPKSIFLLKIITIFLLIYGSLANSLFLWNVVDILIALLGLINIYAINGLSHEIKIKEDN